MIKPTATKKGKSVDLIDLQMIPPCVKPDNAGLYWKEINHFKLADSLRNALLDHSWNVTNERYIVSKDSYDFACSFGIDFPKEEENLLFTPHIGVVNSNARRFSTRWFAGVVTPNLGVGVVLFKGDSRKHGPNFLISKENERFVKQCKKAMPRFLERINSLKSTPVSEPEIVRALILCGRSGIIPWSRIGDADRTSQRITNRWGLLVSICHQIERGPPLLQMMRKLRAKRIIETAGTHNIGKYERSVEL